MNLELLQKKIDKLKGIYNENDIYKIIWESRGRKYTEAKSIVRKNAKK